jgi:dihydroneopterin aldolase
MDLTEPLLHIQPPARDGEEERDVRALFLRNFVTRAHIGVYDRERAGDQRLRFQLCVYLQPPFDWHDQLTDVLDYDRLRAGILDILAEGHVNLLETLAERIVDFCFGYAQVQSVHLQITKLEAHDDCEVGYETRRRR